MRLMKGLEDAKILMKNDLEENDFILFLSFRKKVKMTSVFTFNTQLIY